MSDTLHTYHRTTEPGRGMHVLTTSDHEEAFAMQQAIRLRDALANVLAWEAVIIEAIQEKHGKLALCRELCWSLALAAAVLSQTTPAAAQQAVIRGVDGSKLKGASND